MKLADCAVHGCTGMTYDAAGICPACRTKIQRGEIALLPPVDYRERLDTIFGAALIIVGYFLACVLSSGGPS